MYGVRPGPIYLCWDKTETSVRTLCQEWAGVKGGGGVQAPELRFPENFMKTSLRPDIVSKQVVILELLVPMEEKMEEANKRTRKEVATNEDCILDVCHRSWE